MSEIFCKSLKMHTEGTLPTIGQIAPDFKLCQTDLEEVSLSTYANKAILLNIYPSLDTQVCFKSVQTFFDKLKKEDVFLLCVSMDTAFALKRIASGEDFKGLHLLSAQREPQFGVDYGVLIKDGPFKNLLSRAVFVLNSEHKITHCELVSDISNPPDYEKALKTIKEDQA